ncbi:MAG: hypothetical protein ACR2G3_09065, partial [Solirubrobacterales bacterium]
MEGPDPEKPRAELASRREATRRRTIVLRRVAALAAAVLATAGLWLLLFRDEGSEGDGEPRGGAQGGWGAIAGRIG